jgi:hypothetical protein
MNVALLAPGLSPALKRVEVEVRIRVYDTNEDIQTRKRDAYAFLAGVRETPMCFATLLFFTYPSLNGA